jgi:hypothetical protein
MATVYRARFRAPGGAAKQVALKVIHPHLAHDKDFVLMFLDEMRVAMALSHRNIVQTFDAGRFQDTYFLAMELLDAGSLGSLCQSLRPGERLPLDIALFVAMEICAALAYAHQFQASPDGPVGVIHRDVSPGNMLLSGHGDVKLADFGVAKAAGRLTASVAGQAKGKLKYVAPEQARGQVEPRSDLFALGGVLYWMLTGLPFRDSLTWADVRAAVPEAPVPVRAHRSDVPPTLDHLVSRCLSAAPGQRPTDALELRRALAEELDGAQRDLDQGRDAHARLQAYLEGPRAETAMPGQRSQRLAAAMLEAVEAVPRRDTAPPPPSITSAGTAPGTVPGTVPGIGEERSGPEAGPAGFPATEQKVLTAWALGPLRSPAFRPVAIVGFLGLALGLGILSGRSWFRAALQSARSGSAVVPSGPRPPSRNVGATSASQFSRLGPDGAAPVSGAPLSERLDASLPHHASAADLPPVTTGDQGHGFLTLDADPWCILYVDGKRIGVTPIFRLRLITGRHLLRLHNPTQKRGRTLTVEIRRNASLRKKIVLQ